jgi:hypothetical protein
MVASDGGHVAVIGVYCNVDLEIIVAKHGKWIDGRNGMNEGGRPTLSHDE